MITMSLAKGAAFILGTGLSTVGTVGTLIEMGARKLVDHKQRKIAELVAINLQSIPAALTLIVIGSLSTPGLIAGIIVGTGIILVTNFNAFSNHIKNKTFKKIIFTSNKYANITAKVTNTVILTVGVWMSLGSGAAFIAGLGLANLNYSAYSSSKKGLDLVHLGYLEDAIKKM